MIDTTFALQAHAALNAAKAPPAVGKNLNVEQARRVSQDFEAFFLGQMLQPMFSGIKAEEPFDGGPAEEIWRSMQVDEYGKAIARNGGVGIADAVFREIIKLQGDS